MTKIKECIICGSTKKVIRSKIGLLCNRHYTQYNKYGEIKKRTKYDPNEFIFEENTVKIFLYNMFSQKVSEAIIDREDYDTVKEYKWCLSKNGYVINSKGKYLHRIVTKENTLFVDHINGNKLDNRKCNLRPCSNADNLKNRVKIPINNTSGIIGVIYRSDRNKWRAEICVDGKKIRLGYYANKIDAIRARTEAEIKYFGKYKSKVLNNEIS